MLRTSLVVSILAVSSIALAQAPDSVPVPSAPTGAPPSATPVLAPLPNANAVEQTPSKTFGIGYKLGNGIGLLGGDVVINPFPHIAIDLYAAFVPVTISNGSTSDSANEYAMAPAIQYELYAGLRSTPYVSIGLQYARLTLDNVTASAWGEFANIGYEWNWKSGFGLQLGGGVQYLKEARASSGTTMVKIGGALNPNLEFGVRYMFF
jgi:hypothetical protein